MNRNVAVGLFVLSGVAVFTTGLFMIGSRNELFAKHLIIYTDFTKLSGLAKGSKVQVAGMDAGQVDEIQIPDSPASKFHLKIEINENLHGLVRTDSVATLDTEGIVGDVFLSILPGTAAAPALPAGGTLRSKEAVELSDLLGQAQGTITDVDTTVKNANGLLTTVGGNLNSTLTAVHGTINDVDSVVNGVKRGDGVAGMMLRDPKVADSVRRTLANTEAATASLQHTSTQADALLSDVRSRNFPQKIDDTLASAKDASAKLDDVSGGIRQMVNELNAPDTQGNTAGTTLRETLGNADAATGNIAEDSEALKHNFLFKAFFRHRGYYNLMGIPSATYRKDKTFTNPRDTRLWLDAGALFSRAPSGEQMLTPAGKSVLDQALASSADGLQGTPVMVEGYGETGGGADSLHISRERALLVRKYLRDRFELDPAGIGAVGLGTTPPTGAGHDTWQGICLVLVHGAH